MHVLHLGSVFNPKVSPSQKLLVFCISTKLQEASCSKPFSDPITINGLPTLDLYNPSFPLLSTGIGNIL